MRAETRALGSTVKVEGAPLSRKAADGKERTFRAIDAARVAGLGRICFWTNPGSPYASGAALPTVCSPAPNICTSRKIDIPWFRVLFAQDLFNEGTRSSRNQATHELSGPASSRLLDAFHKPRKFSYVDFSEVLIHSSRMTGTKLRHTFMAPASI